MLSPHERARLRAETQCDDVTIRRWARGDRVHDATHVRLTRAARLLGIVIPERAIPAKGRAS
jgi:hypothetical protein